MRSAAGPDRKLFAPGDRILIAVSGGVDSLALLHWLAVRRGELGIELVAAHVHHGMRGEAAEADVEFLRSTCGAWGVPLEVVYRDVPALAVELGVGVEEAGRRARYEALEGLARSQGCARVATAHHADDQVETLLLHMLRGTGLDGLRGMPERRPLSAAAGAPELIRPLLGVWRHELEAYCREQRLAPRHDITNDDPAYRRNRVRRELMPLLDSLAPAARQNLLRLTHHARDEVAVLDSLARELLERARVEDSTLPLSPRVPAWLVRDRVTPRATLNTGPLALAPMATARRALRLWLRELAGEHGELPLETVDRVLGLARDDLKRPENAVDLPECELRVRRKGDHIEIELQRVEVGKPAAATISAAGSYTLPDFGVKLSIVQASPPDDLRLPPDQACFDGAKVRWPLQMRSPLPGDRFQPLGAPGSRLLSDLFIDRKIPLEARAAWPVLEDGEGIVWVCGLAVAERARVTPGTPVCLHLRVEPWDEPTGTES